MSVDERIALITGASSGIGRACVDVFAARGARVIAVARREDRLDELVLQWGEQVLPLVLDVRDREAVLAAVAGLPEPFAAVDVLINSAGLRAGTELMQNSDPADWDAMIDTNVTGVLTFTHALLPTMVKLGRGHIINVGSNVVRFPYRTGAVYAASKAAIESLSTGMRMDLAGTGVRTTHINLGLTRTEISAVRFNGDPAKIEEHYRGRPALSAEEVADCVLWAVSQPETVEIAEMRVYPTGLIAGAG